MTGGVEEWAWEESGEVVAEALSTAVGGSSFGEGERRGRVVAAEEHEAAKAPVIAIASEIV